MHVPDGFLAPQFYAPATAAAGGLWALGVRRARRTFDRDALPRLSVLTALSFVLMSIVIPLPGGTSVHAVGVAVLALTFGVWSAFLAVSAVLAVQALVLGVGGVTSLGTNALAVGWLGAVAARAAHRAFRFAGEGAARFAAGWFSVVVPALATAAALGVQPALARAPDGTPLFFPFGLRVVVPAVVLPHALLGLFEGALTVTVCRIVGAGGARPAPTDGGAA